MDFDLRCPRYVKFEVGRVMEGEDEMGECGD